jgi:hypothetical protein
VRVSGGLTPGILILEMCDQIQVPVAVHLGEEKKPSVSSRKTLLAIETVPFVTSKRTTQAMCV